MQLSQTRFRLRSLMVWIALAALAMGAWETWRRREVYRARAAQHAREAQEYADVAWGLDRFGRGDDEATTPHAGLYWALHDYHRRLKEKYEQAARRPWSPVAADPPPPRDEERSVAADAWFARP